MGDLLVLWWVWGVVDGWMAGVVTGQCIRWVTCWHCGGCEVLWVDGWQVWWPGSVLDGCLVGTVVGVRYGWMDGRCGDWAVCQMGDLLALWWVWGVVDGWQVWWLGSVLDGRLVGTVVGVRCCGWMAGVVTGQCVRWETCWYCGGCEVLWVDGWQVWWLGSVLDGWLVGTVVGVRCCGWMDGRCGDWAVC